MRPIAGEFNSQGEIVISPKEAAQALRDFAELDRGMTQDEINALDRVIPEIPEEGVLLVLPAQGGPFVDPRVDKSLKILLRELYDAWWVRAGNAYRDLAALVGEPEGVERRGGPPS